MIVDQDPHISVVVTSYNRRELLLQGLEALDRQTLRLEVIVVDDGSNDGSPAAVSEHWPSISVLRNDTGTSFGVARQRSRGLSACSCPYAATFDEDHHLEDQRALETLLAYFDDPRVAVVGVPFRDVLVDGRLQQSAPDDTSVWARHSFIGNGVFFDMAKYRKVGGYHDWLEFYREEEDLSMRLLDAGYVVRVVPGVVEGKHWRKPGGLSAAARMRSARNDILYYWTHAPLPHVVPFVVLTALRNLADGWREGDIRTRLGGILAAPRHGWRTGLRRRPVSMATFRRYRALKGRGPLRIVDVFGEAGA